MDDDDGRDSSKRTSSVDRAIVRRFWDQQAQRATDPRAVTLDRAPRFLASFGVSLYQGWFRRVLSQFQGHASQSVDLGCGNGQWTELLASLSDRVAASDLSPGFVEACRQRCDASGVGARVTVECADASTAHLPRPVDLVVIGGVVQYMGDAEVVELLARLRKALEPKGILYLRTTIGKRSTRTKDHGVVPGDLSSGELVRSPARGRRFRRASTRNGDDTPRGRDGRPVDASAVLSSTNAARSLSMAQEDRHRGVLL